MYVSQGLAKILSLTHAITYVSTFMFLILCPYKRSFGHFVPVGGQTTSQNVRYDVWVWSFVFPFLPLKYNPSRVQMLMQKHPFFYFLSSLLSSFIPSGLSSGFSCVSLYYPPVMDARDLFRCKRCHIVSKRLNIGMNP
jgi:hypothetical protein